MKTVIIGAGQTGLSCVRCLTQKTQDELTLIDTRDQPPSLNTCKKQYPELTVHTGNLSESILLNADRIVISPGLALTDPIWKQVKQANIPILGDVELFAQFAKAPVIGVTGSNGKGTVVTWLKAMCDVAHQSSIPCGNIGFPVLDALLDCDVPNWYLAELSSFQLLSTYSLQTHSAIVLNISEDHLDYHGTMEAYQSAKHRIYNGCGHPIINRDDPRTTPLSLVNQSPVSIGLTPPPGKDDYGMIHDNQQIWLAKGEQKILTIDELRVVGQHNWLNALAAMALADCMELPKSAMIQALKTFKGLAHRCQWVAEHRGVVIYNDSKGTNVGAVFAAIEAVSQTLERSGKVILLMGGQSKGADFSLLSETIKHCVKQIYVFGEDALKIKQSFEPVVAVKHVSSLTEAVDHAIDQARSGDRVLLSPGCASYDMFSGFAERGEKFTQLVLDKIAQ